MANPAPPAWLLPLPRRLAALGTAALWFVPAWFVGAGINMAVGVIEAGYSVAEELPIFLLVFAVPAAVAGIVWWKFGR